MITISKEEMQLHLELLKQFVCENGGGWSSYSDAVQKQLLEVIEGKGK